MASALKIALIQASLAWENPQENRLLLEEKIMEVNAGTDVVVLPEMFNSGFTMNAQKVFETMDGKTLARMKKLAIKKNTAITGSLVIKEKGKFYNRLVFVKPDASVITYDKRHTFTLAGEHKVYAAGTQKIIIEYKGWKICPLVCYDLRFPVWARNTENYDVLLYVANWPKKRINTWDILLQARAIENMSYCIGVNRIGKDGNGYEYSGHSAIYDPLGKTLVYSEDEATLYATLNKAEIIETREKLKFLADRDSFTVN
ncbi:amidohydrolase [Galbibacter pacificus]|uniref:Amidohydrolase n=1 Tax=Galbibacter pacificus TaxID=2996052 RepID=A0ABT6FTM1_9FLAO|nr:amidohydrolase [Galbibacter pacificus]MDG3583125.1 amidohydrolase [Galbibacter pacificus]MDG3586606.1 amidohydrolase [Galbibacter pacificus]